MRIEVKGEETSGGNELARRIKQSERFLKQKQTSERILNVASRVAFILKNFKIRFVCQEKNNFVRSLLSLDAKSLAEMLIR